MDSWIVADKLHGMAWQNVTLYGYGVISNDGSRLPNETLYRYGFEPYPTI